MNRMEKNPWLKVTAADYEGHMSSVSVGQLSMLAETFAGVIERFQPGSICVPGSATGNGFEFLRGKKINKITGIEINPGYVSICKDRFEKTLPGLELICADLSEVIVEELSFDLIHAALVLEYIEVEPALEKFYSWLKAGGILSVLLQLPSESVSPVSETEYESIKNLAGFIKLVDPDKLKSIAERLKMKLTAEEFIEIKNGKNFLHLIYKK